MSDHTSNIYNPALAIAYANQYAFTYNPIYPDYADVEPGGDCANFISQCIHAGGMPMIGYNANDALRNWFCRSDYLWAIEKISKSWRGAYYFYIYWSIHAKASREFSNDALTLPVLHQELLAYAAPGDAISLIHESGTIYHTLLIMDVTSEDIICAAHTNNTVSTPLTHYNPYRLKIYQL
ncbi:MAG: amidase domain-containing protein [Cellulosilyticaceae bacterium]